VRDFRTRILDPILIDFVKNYKLPLRRILLDTTIKKSNVEALTFHLEQLEDGKVLLEQARQIVNNKHDCINCLEKHNLYSRRDKTFQSFYYSK
jgi:hypothetical protein